MHFRLSLIGGCNCLTGKGYDALDEGGVSVEHEEDCSKSPSTLPHELNLGRVRGEIDNIRERTNLSLEGECVIVHLSNEVNRHSHR